MHLLHTDNEETLSHIHEASTYLYYYIIISLIVPNIVTISNSKYK